jgi:hypothetical protein
MSEKLEAQIIKALLEMGCFENEAAQITNALRPLISDALDDAWLTGINQALENPT